MRLFYLLIILKTVIIYSQDMSMSKWEGKIIPYKKALFMLKKFEGKEIKVDSLKSDDVYLLNDERILLISDILEEGVIYPSKVSLFKTLNSEVLDANFKKVVQSIPENILRLSELTGLELSMIDKKEKLKVLDDLIHTKGDISINTYIEPLTAYFGQVIANEVKGTWKYTKEKEEERIYIEIDRKQYYFYHYLIDMLIEGVNDRFSLEGLCEYVINPIEFKTFNNNFKTNN